MGVGGFLGDCVFLCGGSVRGWVLFLLCGFWGLGFVLVGDFDGFVVVVGGWCMRGFSCCGAVFLVVVCVFCVSG